MSETRTHYRLLETELELHDEATNGAVDLFERHYFRDGEKVVEYKTVRASDGQTRYWVATKDPEDLTDEERHRVLRYCLSSFNDDEIVNYKDLFIQSEFIKEV